MYRFWQVKVLIIALVFFVIPAEAEVSICYRKDSALLRFAVGELEKSLKQNGEKVTRRDLLEVEHEVDIMIIAGKGDDRFLKKLGEEKYNPKVQADGFEILRNSRGSSSPIYVVGGDERGAMYGTLELAEQVHIKEGLKKVKGKLLNPTFEFRAIKFNLPWYSYRSNDALSLHTETCRDLKFWQEFLDMMAMNRFNVLSLWNMHPFTYMIRPKNFPKACGFSDEQLDQWQQFWRELFKMAKERGIETYIVNWNIVVSPEFAEAYGAKQYNDTSELVRKYTQECVTQVINEYDDLTGLGVTLADWMRDMSPKQREDWIEETFVMGMKQAGRKIKFIHRSVLAGSPIEMRRVIDNAQVQEPVWVEIKFNWSHGHSTPHLAMTHDYESGKIDERFWDPKPVNYKIAWMIRNEDFFLLRWGQPGFIREHIAVNNDEYVGGYFVGSETYIPAKDYFHISEGPVKWKYAFQKQWLFYMLWGRLLYDVSIEDEIFIAAFNTRYGKKVGKKLFEAFSLASKMPLKLASFHAATWDFTLYSEGFLAAAQSRGLFDGVSPFISINELIDHKTLDPTYISIPDYVRSRFGEKKIETSMVTPIELAVELESDGKAALALLDSIKLKTGMDRHTLGSEMVDVRAWSYLSLYFADKLRAGVALEMYREAGDIKEKKKAVKYLTEASGHWDSLIDLTKINYREVPSVHLGQEKFSWKNFRDEVARDIEIALEE